MADKSIPSHEEIEHWVRTQPLDVIGRVGDDDGLRKARQLITEAEALVHESRERIKPESSDQTT